MSGRALMALPLALFACKAEVTDLDGRTVDPLSERAPAVVLLFLSTSCPISNRYAPEIRTMAVELAPRGARFFLVYPNAGERNEDIKAHLSAYALALPALRDPAHTLVGKAGVRVTPE